MKTLSLLKNTFINGRRAVNVLRLAGGVLDTETVTIGPEVYEVDTAAPPGSITAGRIRVDCNGGVTNTLFGTALVAAIKANSTLFDAEKISATEVLVWTKGEGTAYACSETLATANNAWASATMYDGAAGTPPTRSQQRRAAIAQEVTLGTMHFVFPFTVASAIVVVRAAAGTIKAWGGVLSFSGPRVTLTNNASVDFAATDTVDVLAST